MCGIATRLNAAHNERTRVSDQRAGWAAGRKGSVVVEGAGPDRWCDPDDGKHDNRVQCRKQDVQAQTVVEISKVARRFLRVVVVRCFSIIISVVVMVVHDHLDVFAEVLHERNFALFAIYDMYEITLRGSDGLPRK